MSIVEDKSNNTFGQNPEKSDVLEDVFGRQFPYLRLSITDVCNFRCQYCLPNGYEKPQGKPVGFLSREEINNLIAGFASLGLRKVRITGGEPTVRRDFEDIVSDLLKWPQIERRAFTTNGYKLYQNAEKWHACGLNAINVSVDSMDEETFKILTGHDKLLKILAGIEAAIECGFERVKLNAVLHKGIHDRDLEPFLEYAKNNPITWQFIELMQTGDNKQYFDKYHLDASFIEKRLLVDGWKELQRDPLAGPARIFEHAEYKGKVGIIAPYSKNFCTTCNRLRVTATGDLRLCLFGDWGIPLRKLLQNESDHDELVATLQNQLKRKSISHRLHEGNVGITKHLASVGG